MRRASSGRTQRSSLLEAAARGALFHPNLNWFLNASHDDDAVNEAVSIAEEAFRATSPPADS